MMRRRAISLRPGAEDGFTMIIAIGVLLVTSLLMVAAFTVAEGEVQLARNDTTKKQAYYAALAGVQQYENELQSNPDYWESCEGISSTVPEEANDRYVVTPVTAESAPKGAKCTAENPAAAMIQTKGQFANTFRIKSVGEVRSNSTHTSKATVIATFGVTGFLDYVYYTNFETEDPGLYPSSEATLAAQCANKYYPEWNGKYACHEIQFKPEDIIKGPLHTNDSALIGGEAHFGRKEHVPADVVEMYRGSHGAAAGCPAKVAVYYTTTKCYIEKSSKPPAEELRPPPDDESLGAYVLPEYDFVGAVKIELKGTEMQVTYHDAAGAEHTKLMPWPANGLIYVEQNKELGCGYHFVVEESDKSTEWSEEKGCGNVYVTGEYSKSLTIASTGDVIVQKNVIPTGLSSLGAEPTGTAVLGLIAGEYVRYYHRCSSSTGNAAEDPKDPWIYAGILATKHSWTVDNHSCGSLLGKINVYGAIAQDYRGIVIVGSSGYEKNYLYDERLATNEPPYFLAPLKAGWKIVRETAPSAG